MKKLSLLFVAVMSAIFCIAQPEIKFENTTYDFGKIKEEGGKVTGKFIFTNVGNEPLELTLVKMNLPVTLPPSSLILPKS